jgi:hypothetical protein
MDHPYVTMQPANRQTSVTLAKVWALVSFAGMVFFTSLLCDCGNVAGETPTHSTLPTLGAASFTPGTALAGQALDSLTALYAPGIDPNGDPVVLIWLTTAANTCDLLSTSSQAAGATVIGVQLTQVSPYGNRQVPSPQTDFQVVGNAAQENGQGAYAGITVFALDASCSQTLTQAQSIAISGDLFVLNWSGTGAPLAGSMTATVGTTGIVLKGQFNAAYCAALGNNPTSPPTQCAP